MEILIIIALILIAAVLVLLFLNRKEMQTSNSELKEQIDDVRKRLNTINNRIIDIQKNKSGEFIPKEEKKINETLEIKPEKSNEETKIPKFDVDPEKVKIHIPVFAQKHDEFENKLEQTEKKPEQIEQKQVIENPNYNKNPQTNYNQYSAQNSASGTIKTTQKPQKDNDFEKFIGENLLVKIAVLILVIGMVFLLKWAIDNNWIGEAARIGVGLVSGGLLVGLAHLSRKKYDTFASVLAGGGLAILYASVALGFQLYQLFSQELAFVMLILITVFTVILSVGYDKKELAVFAIIGGFASPFLVATGAGNYVVLFTYIIILDLGMLALAYFKKWHIVNVFALLFTFILYGGWLGSTWYDENMPYLNAFGFATGFYLIFFAMFVMHNVIAKHKVTILDFSLLMSATFSYYLAGMLILDEVYPTYKGIFTISIAVFNFIFVLPLYKSEKIDKRLIFFLITIVLTFLSLTAPVQLDGQYITIFWATESVVLLWLSPKTDIKLMRIFSFILVFLTAFSLFMDWYNIYFKYHDETYVLNIVLNKGFITSLTVIASYIAISFLLRNDTKTILNKLNPQTYSIFIALLIMVFMYFAMSFELSYHLNRNLVQEAQITNLYGVFHFSYFLWIMIWVFIKRPKIVSIILSALTLINVVVFMTHFNFEFTSHLDTYLMKNNERDCLPPHILTSVTVMVTLYLIWLTMKKIFSRKHFLATATLWIAVAVSVFILSADITNIMLKFNEARFFAFTEEQYTDFWVLYESVTETAHRTAWPILWGVSSFILIIIGLKTDNKQFRIIALALFFVTLIKLFAWDVWHMSQGGKVIAFISLGVLLLIVAFVYQKLKVLLFEAKEELDNTENNLENKKE